ncbi:hypothetical protein SEA_CULVER_145 [Gordonia phage Culver]|nr:hypothetical protein SEA_CULVER_145 [Gordonia phage Culver]
MSTIETNDKGQDFAVSTTGGKKQKKLARYDLIPAGPLLELAELYGRGAAKYADRNWENGYDWSLSFSALQRHAWQFWDGENFDEETGAAHLASVAWHALALLQFMQQQKYAQFDDRPRTESIVEADVHEDHVHIDPDPVATSPEPANDGPDKYDLLEWIPVGQRVTDKHGVLHRYNRTKDEWERAHSYDDDVWVDVIAYKSSERAGYNAMYGPFTVVASEADVIQVGDSVQVDPGYQWFNDGHFETGVDYRVESKTLDAVAGGGAYVTIAGRGGGWDISRFRKSSASCPEPIPTVFAAAVVPESTTHNGHVVPGQVSNLGTANYNYVWRDRFGRDYTHNRDIYEWTRSDGEEVPAFPRPHYDSANGPYTRVGERDEQ